MTAGGPWRAASLLLVACAALFSGGSSFAQAPALSYEVRRGDTLFAIARKAKHDGVSRNQMILAIYRANPAAFPGGNLNLLSAGTVLVIPPRETVGAIDAADADRSVADLLAKSSPAVPAVPPQATPKPAPAKPVAEVPANPEELGRRYQEGLALERRGDDRGALEAFLAAGEGGYGLAQKKLGEIYDKGNSVVQRDYQTALRWYQLAREQGVAIPKPFVRSPR